MTYGFKMTYDVADSKIISMLKEAEEELNRIVKVVATLTLIFKEILKDQYIY